MTATARKLEPKKPKLTVVRPPAVNAKHPGNPKHGYRYSGTYASWCAMRTRCTNPKAPQYASYGGRGIIVCKRWLVFANFLADMGERPEGLTLDRRDNDKGYFKNNCRWATKQEQNRNTRRSRLIKFRGKTMCLGDWAKEFGINRTTLFSRLKAGVAFKRALGVV